jgi:hypothetical protein
MARKPPRQILPKKRPIINNEYEVWINAEFDSKITQDIYVNSRVDGIRLFVDAKNKTEAKKIAKEIILKSLKLEMTIDELPNPDMD